MNLLPRQAPTPPIRSNWHRAPRHDRRALLKILGVAPVLAPFVPRMDAFAAEAPVRRLVLWFTPHGTIWNRWRTGGPASSPTLGPILAPLKKHLPSLTVLEGLRIRAEGIGAPHTKGPPLLWTASKLIEDMTFMRGDGAGGKHHGWNSGPSVDQAILQRFQPKTAYPSLEFGVRCAGNHPGTRTIYAAAEKPLSPESSPMRAFTRIFGGLLADQQQIAAQIADRKSVIDLVKADLDSFRARLAGAERSKLNAHLDAIRGIETRLKVPPQACVAPPQPADLDFNAPDNTPAIYDAQIDLLAAALACGLANVASMQYRIGENDGKYTYNWLGVTKHEHHLLTHSADSDTASWAMVEKIYVWYAEKFARFLDRLAAIPEGNGTMLDHTLVVWGSELGKGNNHSFNNVPFVVAGGQGFGVKGNRALRFPDGLDHNRLLVSLFHYMGLKDVAKFGGTDIGQGPLPGLI